jgi:hypothetical protein
MKRHRVAPGRADERTDALLGTDQPLGLQLRDRLACGATRQMITGAEIFLGWEPRPSSELTGRNLVRINMASLFV